MPEIALRGDALLDAVTAAMVALHVRYYGREPGRERRSSWVATSWPACSATCTPTSRRFQEVMEHRFVGEVERLTVPRCVRSSPTITWVPTSKSSCSSWRSR